MKTTNVWKYFEDVATLSMQLMRRWASGSKLVSEFLIQTRTWIASIM